MKKAHSLPETIFLVVNSQCNLRCRMCDIGQGTSDGQFYRVMNRNGTSLLPETIYGLLDDTASWKPAIAITGTEPLLYTHLRAVARRVLEAGHRLQITTNGFLLRDYADFFVKVGLSELWVSMDGPPEVHDFIRGVKGAFERAAGGIRRVQEGVDSSGRQRPGISLNFTISHFNQHHLVSFLDSIVKEGIRPVRITFCHTNFVTESMAGFHNERWGSSYTARASCTSAFDPRKISAEILWNQIMEVRERDDFRVSFSPELRSREQIEIFYQHPEQFVTPPYCNMAHSAAQILSDGTLTASTRCMDISLGNVRNARFPDLWEGEKRRQFLADLDRVGAFPVCSRCCGVF